LWRLFLMAGIAMLAGMSQLRFLLRLTDQATRDGLTGLLVRGTGEEILENQFAYAQRQKLPFAVIFIDIDRFKSVNDEFGHEAGDAVLREVAAQIGRAFRHQDIQIRWGGEEFVVGLPGANVANAEVAVLRLAKIGLGLRPDQRPVTASVGIAEWQADQLGSLNALVERADARMYEAKTSGRNRYVFRNGPKLWIGQSDSHSRAA
jgi:diguanylate cyclase (GGDEF)-like protein